MNSCVRCRRVAAPSESQCLWSQLLEAGGELHDVQATLGHTNITMTSTYLSATTQGVKQAFKKLEAK